MRFTYHENLTALIKEGNIVFILLNIKTISPYFIKVLNFFIVHKSLLFDRKLGQQVVVKKSCESGWLLVRDTIIC